MRTVAVVAGAVLASGCSLFLDGEADRPSDSCERPGCPVAVVEHRIGPGGDYATVSDWVSERAGDLVDREVIAVRGIGEGELGDGDELIVEGCYTGVVVGSGQLLNGVVHITVESPVQVEECQAGASVLGTSGTFAGLIGVGVIERGVVAAGTYLDNVELAATTSADRYMWLTAEEDARHLGDPTAGVILQGATPRLPMFHIHAAHTRIEWIAIDNWLGNAEGEAAIAIGAEGVELHRIMIRDADLPATTAPAGILVGDDPPAPIAATISNSVIRDVAGACIAVNQGGHQLRVVNTTLSGCWRNFDNGAERSSVEVGVGSNAFVDNVISVASGVPSFESTVSSTLGTASNFHDDPTTPLEFSTATTALDLFEDPAGILRLIDGSPADGSGVDLGPDFAESITGEIRENVWNAGAY